jgi:AraC-like DNA-binding protein
MTAERHLILQELTLQPSVERLPCFEGWLMARVSEGFGYWLQHDTSARQLTVGDGFVVTGNANGVVRASQLGTLKLQFFTVQPRHLTGVFTVAEWHQFEIAPGNSSLPVLFFKATEPVGQKFTRIVGLLHTDRLPLRCGLLQLWATATADLLPTRTSDFGNDNKLRERFRRLVGQMPEVELYSCSPTNLAQQLHCSKRHLNRLFQEEFGVPLRTRQIKLQSQHTSQLLADSNAQIGAAPMTVAADNSSLSTSYSKNTQG